MSAGRQFLAPFTSASEEDLVALRRALAWTKGFALFIVVCDGPARAEMILRLKAWSGDGDVPLLAFFPGGEAGRAALERLLDAIDPGPPLPGAVFVDGDTLVEQQTPVHAMNAARDRLGRIFAGPLVLLLAASREAELARLAPDLFDIRSATYEVNIAEAHVTEFRSTAFPLPALWLRGGVTRWQPSGLGQRSDHLRELEKSTTKPPNAALADVWLDLGQELLHVGDSDGARTATKEAERLAQAASYLHGLAASLRLRAAIEGGSGKPDEARSLLREVIRILDKLGDKRGRAESLYQLARIELTEGNFEAARPLLYESIQINVDISNHRGHAASLRALAIVEYASNKFAEAISLLRESIRINDEHESRHNRALSLVSLGRLLSEEGQREEALTRMEEGIVILEELGAPELAQAREMLRKIQEIE